MQVEHKKRTRLGIADVDGTIFENTEVRLAVLSICQQMDTCSHLDVTLGPVQSCDLLTVLSSPPLLLNLLCVKLLHN